MPYFSAALICEGGLFRVYVPSTASSYRRKNVYALQTSTACLRSEKMWDQWDWLTDSWTEMDSQLGKRNKLVMASLGVGEILGVAEVSGFRRSAG